MTKSKKRTMSPARRRLLMLDVPTIRARLDDLGKKVTRARRDPAAFAEFAFTDPKGKRLKLGRVHRELQEFLSAHHHALIELPRDHGKSVQVCTRVLWELGHNPALRVKVICATEAMAAERGRFLRNALAHNMDVQLVFKELQPAKPWEVTRFTIERPAEALGPSVTCLGVGCGATGSRADLLICDDIVDVKSLRSPADRERVRTYFRENLVNLLEPTGRIWCLFTPWHGEDINAELKRNDTFAHFRRAIGPDLEPVWPEHWPRHRLTERRKEIGETAFARAYRLECVAEGDIAIRPEWLQTWSGEHQYDMIALAVDPAAGTSDRSDCSAVVALGRLKDGPVHCLEAFARRVRATDLVRLLEDADKRWRPDAILFENIAGFAAVYDLFAKHTSFGPKLRPIVNSKHKELRMQAFGVHVQNGRFLLKSDGNSSIDPRQIELYDELTAFPHGDLDDLADAAAFGATWLLDRPSPRIW
jgi:predicted phage terminase large subunit-like protein